MDEFFSDPSGEFSMMRLMCFFWGTTVLIVWCYLSIDSGEMVDIPNGVGLALAGLFGSKAMQSFAEHKHDND